VVADVPGLIGGAHAGHGLGHQFLKHIERTRCLVHLVDVSGASERVPLADFEIIRRELELYNPELMTKPHLVVANKIDALEDPAQVARIEARAHELGLQFFRLSGVTGEGVPELLEACWRAIAQAHRDSADDHGEPDVVDATALERPLGSLEGSAPVLAPARRARR